MTVVLLLLLAGLQTGSTDPFDVQSDLQGIYDELSQATMQFDTPADIDMFHTVFYTPDWVFVDAAGQRHSWTEMRAQDVQALAGPRLDSMQQPIQKVSLAKDGATVTAKVIIVRTIVDDEGRYGRKGATHTQTESTVVRDTWVKSGDAWKLKSREQVGKPAVSVDHAPSLM